MEHGCTLQLHRDGAWHDVATVGLLGPLDAGWRAKTYSGYGLEWAFRATGARDAHALSATWPVSLEPLQLTHWPVFLIDMLPQGHGRQELLRRLGLAATADTSADWNLLLTGAGNPIGHLRVKEAAQWLETNAGPQQGFSDDEVAQRGEEFAEYLASHGLFVAGSSGVQGEWPKLLLTRSHDGLLYLDHTLPDHQAAGHYIVKFGRGSDRDLASILRNEAPYMNIANMLGLRVHGPLYLRHRALFIPRFDRQVVDGSVIRLAQESIASLTGMPGFDTVPSHDQVCRALIEHCTHPQQEVLEYIKRDVANLALGNKDNHARNTAVQRNFTGHVALTPMYDFAPMYRHPDGIARRIRWDGNDAGRPDWSKVLDRVCELGKHPIKPRNKTAALVDRDYLVQGLRDMAPRLERVAEEGEAMGLETEVLTFLRPGMLRLAGELAALN